MAGLSSLISLKHRKSVNFNVRQRYGCRHNRFVTAEMLAASMGIRKTQVVICGGMAAWCMQRYLCAR
jgi:hypothetical protein